MILDVVGLKTSFDPGTGRQWQVDLSVFEAGLAYMVIESNG